MKKSKRALGMLAAMTAMSFGLGGGSGFDYRTGEYIRNYETTTPITADLSPADMGRLEDEKIRKAEERRARKMARFVKGLKK